MDFLKEILEDELFNQLNEKITTWNGDEKNKENQIKIGNLGKGGYVNKFKYDELNTLLSSKDNELVEANKLIAELKKSTKDNETIQQKITDYDNQVKELQNQLKDTKLKSAIKVALLSEKAVDIDYLTFKLNEKLKEKNETLELDENENIKGWNDRLADLKIQFPTQFETSKQKKIEENKLPNPNDDKKITKNDIFKMSYTDRAKFQSENPTEYEELMK